MLDVLLDEHVELLAPDRLLQQGDEEETLLVGHEGVELVRVLAGAVGLQARERRVGTERRQSVVQAVASDGGRQRLRLLAVQLLVDAALGPDREALVQPEVVDGGVRDQVAGPRVRELVRQHVDQRTVACQQRRRQERQAGVLHAAVGEARGHDQEVEPVPQVGPEHVLGREQHAVDLGELPGGAVERLRLGVDARARAQVLRDDVPHREREQVGRDRLRHRERERARAGARAGTLFAGRRGHHRGQRFGHG